MAAIGKCDCGEQSKQYVGTDRVDKAREWIEKHETWHKEYKSAWVSWFAAAPPMNEKTRQKINTIVQQQIQ